MILIAEKISIKQAASTDADVPTMVCDIALTVVSYVFLFSFIELGKSINEFEIGSTAPNIKKYNERRAYFLNLARSPSIALNVLQTSLFSIA